MKKLLALAALVSLSIGVKAQNPVGKFSLRPMAGVNISTLANGKLDIYKTKVGFTGGFEMEYGVNKWLGASAGFVYSQQGAKVDGTLSMLYNEDQYMYYTITKMNGKLKCDYLNIPVMANIYIPSIKGLAIKAGVQLGILVNDQISLETITVVDRELQSSVVISDNDGYPIVTSQNTTQSDICKSVDFGIPVGLSYEYKNITLDARYYFGLTKIDKTENPDNARNRYLSITLGYRFGL
jgi:hypothetical protein